MAIIVNLDIMMARRKISLGELAEKIDITPANLSILKTGKAKAIRFSTLEAICRVLDCQPGIFWSIRWMKKMEVRHNSPQITQILTQDDFNLLITSNIYLCKSV